MWLPEFWAHDALSPLGALAHATVSIRLGTAVVQLGTRTPAMLAMSAMTLQQLSGGRFVLGVDLTVAVSCEFTDDLDAAGRRHAEGYAFTFGAMGSGTTNFYNRAFERQGFGDAVAEVQRLWLAGDRDAARRAVPSVIGLHTNLIGPADEVKRRLREYRDCGVGTIRVNPTGDTLDAQLDGLGQLLDLLRDLNNETSPA